MPKIGTMKVSGNSGNEYAFDLYRIEITFKALGAVYIITKRVAKSEGGGSHTYLYVGETGDLSTLFNDHHKQPCFDRNGANCIGINLDDSEDSRLSKESDIRDAHSWPCND